MSIADKIRFMLGASGIKRFHTIRTIHEDSVASHSWGVAWLVGLMVPIEQLRPQLLLMALAHDMAEQDLGDTPSPTKRALGVNAQITDLEEGILELVDANHLLSQFEERVLKVADLLDGMLFCIRERQLGNARIEIVYIRFDSYLTNYDVPDCAWPIIASVRQMWSEAMAGVVDHPTQETFLERVVAQNTADDDYTHAKRQEA